MLLLLELLFALVPQREEVAVVVLLVLAGLSRRLDRCIILYHDNIVISYHIIISQQYGYITTMYITYNICYHVIIHHNNMLTLHYIVLYYVRFCYIIVQASIVCATAVHSRITYTLRAHATI